jgi:hypothetical protein
VQVETVAPEAVLAAFEVAAFAVAVVAAKAALLKIERARAPRSGRQRDSGTSTLLRVGRTRAPGRDPRPAGLVDPAPGVVPLIQAVEEALTVTALPAVEASWTRIAVISAHATGEAGGGASRCAAARRRVGQPVPRGLMALVAQARNDQVRLGLMAVRVAGARPTAATITARIGPVVTGRSGKRRVAARMALELAVAVRPVALTAVPHRVPATATGVAGAALVETLCAVPTIASPGPLVRALGGHRS